MVYPGTAAYEWAKENGYLITEDFSCWLTAEGWHNCVVSRPDLGAKDLVRLCDEARIRFYLRPRYFAKRFSLIIRSWQEAKRTFKSAKTFLNYLVKVLAGRL
jgi:hypothetical protein